MGNIIYKSDNIIPWDTQSAFKMTNYRVSVEENMIFCYLKTYVHGGDLVLCSYCFTENPKGNDNLHLYINLNPENREDILKIDFGFDGIKEISYRNKKTDIRLEYRPFKSDDEQGFYWCGELVLKADTIENLSGKKLEEDSIFTLNMTQTFANGDMFVLFGNPEEENFKAEDCMDVFVLLNY